MPLQLHYNDLKFTLYNSRLKIGRAPLNEIAIPTDQQLSSQHCTITNGILVDARSTNGTTVNGNKVSHGVEYTLKHNDVIVAGETTFNIVDTDIGDSHDAGKVTEESKQTTDIDNDNAVNIVDNDNDSVILSSEDNNEILDINNMLDHNGSDISQNTAASHTDDLDSDDIPAISYKPLLVTSSTNNSTAELQAKINELIAANQHLEQRLAHQQRRQNLAANKLKMQRFESQIESLQYQMLYGDSVKDQEIQLLQKKLQAFQHTRSNSEKHFDTSNYDDLSQQQLIELTIELQHELMQTNQKHTQTLRQMHLLSQQLRDTQCELEAIKQQQFNNNSNPSNSSTHDDNLSSSEHNKTMKFDSHVTELLRQNTNNNLNKQLHTSSDDNNTVTPQYSTDNSLSKFNSIPISSNNVNKTTTRKSTWLNQSVLIASSLSVVFGIAVANIFK